jgi:hypothetical protein
LPKWHGGGKLEFVLQHGSSRSRNSTEKEEEEEEEEEEEALLESFQIENIDI